MKKITPVSDHHKIKLTKIKKSPGTPLSPTTTGAILRNSDIL